nr:OmpA family protein [Cellulomonas sp. Leaf334]
MFNLGQVRLLDLAASTVSDPAQDARSRSVSTHELLTLTPGASVTAEVVYAAPTSPEIAVLFPYLGLVAGVPVEEVATLPTTPEDLGAEGAVTYPSAGIDVFTVAYDDSSTARVEGDAATVTLASDVLFATDEFVLTPEAAAVVDAAGEQIATSGLAGEVTVVGHTDDVGTDAYNQDLSVRRAQSVADRLAPVLGDGFTVVVDGRGESEPVASGSSPEERAVNRRVEIRFTTADAGAAVDVPAVAPVPEPDAPVSSGGEPVSVELDAAGYDVTATSVVRAEGYLVGSLEVERTSPGTGQVVGLFGSFAEGRDLERGLGSLTTTAGAYSASLLGAGGRLYPGDYVVEEGVDGQADRRAVIADRFLDQQVAQGESLHVTVLWPDLGGDSVDIDVPGRFRITDVPVTEP